MGFFSDLGKVLDPAGVFGDDNNAIFSSQNKESKNALKQAEKSGALQREQYDIARKDAEPLRALRDENINQLLRINGIGQPADITSFNASPEFTTVRDAALKVQGTPEMQAALNARATNLGTGEFNNYQNRILNTAGFSSDGLASSNRLLQQNIDDRTNIMNNAGAGGAASLAQATAQRQQAAGGILSAFAMFSDVRLKANARKIGVYHSGIPKYEWDWNEKAKKLVGSQPNVGPMAHEVYKKMPENITVVNGYLVIKDMRMIDVS